MAKFALARTEEPLSVEQQESGAELKQEALQVLEQLEYSRSEAQRMVDEIFSRHKNLKTTEDFLRRVFEQLHPGEKS
jgi:Holliday junction resolvasome RuvABC DNA-binding subunit